MAEPLMQVPVGITRGRRKLWIVRTVIDLHLRELPSKEIAKRVGRTPRYVQLVISRFSFTR